MVIKKSAYHCPFVDIGEIGLVCKPNRATELARLGY